MSSAIPILLYHSIGSDCATAYREWLVTPLEFDDHLRVLNNRGYTPVTVSRLVEQMQSGKPLLEKTAVVSFDDGLHDFLSGAMPVLDRHRIPATLYVVSGHIGGTSKWLAPLGEGNRPMLSHVEIRDLDKAGIEIGAHTVNHPELDVLAETEARSEIDTSKHALEDVLGKSVSSFAYPHGYSNATTRRLVREAGFRSACRVAHAFSAPGETLFSLSRIIMTSAITADGLGALLDHCGLPIAPPVERPAALAWRAARMLRYRIRRLHVVDKINEDV